jgi:hypothetical protein
VPFTVRISGALLVSKVPSGKVLNGPGRWSAAAPNDPGKVVVLGMDSCVVPGVVTTWCAIADTPA